jgi:hypothetical protein
MWFEVALHVDIFSCGGRATDRVLVVEHSRVLVVEREVDAFKVVRRLATGRSSKEQ